MAESDVLHLGERAYAAGERPHRFAYRNYKGEVEARTVRGPYRLWWGCTTFHPTPCLLLDAYDVGRGAVRTYRVVDVLGAWTEVADGQAEG